MRDSQHTVGRAAAAGRVARGGIVRRAAAVASVALCIGVAGGFATFHTHLKRSTPADGATLGAAPYLDASARALFHAGSGLR